MQSTRGRSQEQSARREPPWAHCVAGSHWHPPRLSAAGVPPFTQASWCGQVQSGSASPPPSQPLCGPHSHAICCGRYRVFGIERSHPVKLTWQSPVSASTQATGVVELLAAAWDVASRRHS